MRILLLLAATVCLGLSAGSTKAADLTVPRHKEAAVPHKAPPKRVACLKWVPQNYSWYNYCDPVPNYGRHQNHWFPGLFDPS